MIGSGIEDSIEFGDDPYKHQLERTMELLEAVVSSRQSIHKVATFDAGV
jgi:hypothetical protein